MAIRIRECEIVYRTRNVDAPSRTVASSEDVYRLVPELLHRAHESLVVLLLDIRRQVIGKHEVARGNTATCPVEGSAVFRAAVVANASAIILVHNHPSGVSEPSAEDLELTKRLQEGGKLLGVAVLDHVIVTPDGYYSMLDGGLLK
ncbi:MAG TPA: JAB domain-containing protein [Polyangiaceae bacterium]|nr:JAB domain-containing protein [Polyangiaceae bacterium]